MTYSSITPKELFERISQGGPIHLIDVRTPSEYREIHVELAKNVPLDRLNRAALGMDSDCREPVYVICRSGGRSRQACQSLLRSGLTSLVNVEGGTLAWEQAGLPVVRGEKTIALDRQVRIIVGAMVIISSLLAMYSDPRWAMVSVAMGAGLLHAGIFDSCMMAMCLAKLPWNQSKS